MTPAHAKRRPKPKPRHPIDVVADALRESDHPRENLTEAIDDLLAEWFMRGLDTPIVTVANWLRTLTSAAIEAETRIHGRRLSGDPEAEPWRKL